MNREFFGSRWTAGDLEELAAPRFGVVSGFDRILEDLDRIRARNLGDIGPGWAP